MTTLRLVVSNEDPGRVEFRLVRSHDAELAVELFDLIQVVLRANGREALPANFDIRPWLGASGGIALVAVRRGRVVGGVVAKVERPWLVTGAEIHVQQLAVSAAHGHAGIGTQLIERLTAIAAERGLSGVVLRSSLLPQRNYAPTADRREAQPAG